MIEALCDFAHNLISFISYLTRRQGSLFLLTFSLFFFMDMPRYMLTDTLTFIVVYLIPRKPEDIILKKTPLVSVLIPAYNEGESIILTINSLLNNNYPNLEIIVIDDGSTDRTCEICKPFEDKRLIRLFRNKKRYGKAYSLNLGLKEAKGEYIIPVDSDTTFSKDVIENLLYHFKDPKVGAVSGNICVRNPKVNLLTKLQACEYLQSISLGRRFLSFANLLPIVSGAFGCYRKDVLSSVGGWEPELGEDLDISLKVRELNLKIKFEPEAIAYTHAPERVRSLIKQRFRWDKGYLRMFFKKHYCLLNPFKHNPSNFLTALDNLIFQVLPALLPIFFPLIYFFIYRLNTIKADLLVFPFIFILAYLIYSLYTFLSLSYAIILSKNPPQHLYLLKYAFLIPLYRLCLLKPVRIISYLEEFLALNYQDSFYPEEVWDTSPQW